MSTAISDKSARSPADGAAVSDTIQAMYAAVADDDFERAKSFFAPDFYIFDSGVHFDADGILNVIREARRSGGSFTWNVTEPKVRFSSDVAWITYVNRGAIVKSGQETPAAWLESGVLQHRNGRWVILFMHSSRVQAQ
jgi:ketosteroid isomerase-like protein